MAAPGKHGRVADSDDLQGGTKSEHLVKVRKLREGTVIDHLTSGTAFNAFRVLGLNNEEGVVLIGMNLRSSKIDDRKDIIKIENRELTRDEMNRIALMSPHATISIIREYKVIRKLKVELSEIVERIVKCPNPNCITNVQAVSTRFNLCKRNPITLRCRYCERRVSHGEFEFVI